MILFRTFSKIGMRRLPILGIYLFVYFLLLFAFGRALPQELSSQFQKKALKIAIIDQDETEVSHALSTYLSSIHEPVEIENDKESIQNSLYYRHIRYVLIIPKGFEESFLSGKADGLLEHITLPGTYSGELINLQVSQYLQSLGMYLTGDFSIEEAIEFTGKNALDAESVNLVSFDEQGSSSQKNVFYTYQYAAYIFILVVLSGLAPILILFNKEKILKRTDCSALPVFSKNVQMILGSVLYSLFIFCGFLVLTLFSNGNTPFEKMELYAVLNGFVFFLFSVGLAFLLSQFTPNGNVLNMVSNTFGLVMCFLGGVFVPQSMMQENVLTFSRFLPTYWYIRNNNMLAGFSDELFSLSAYRTYLGIEFLYVLAVFVAACVVIRVKKK